MDALEADPPNIDPVDYGWEKGSSTEILSTTVDSDVTLVPSMLQRLIKWGCKAETPCKVASNCTCRKADLVCTVFCSCSGQLSYCNKRKETNNVDEKDDDDE